MPHQKDRGLFSVSGKTFLITGAASGLAKEVAIALVEYDVNLILFDINEEGLKSTAQTIVSLGGACQTFVVDQRDKRQIDSIMKKIAQQPIDVLLNIAGVLLYKSTLDTTEEEWDKIFDCNVKGLFLMSQAVAKHMICHKTKGVILHFSSLCGFRGQKNALAYGSAKSALNIFTKNMALELAAHNIRVNLIAPGWMLTPMVEQVLSTTQGQRSLQTVPLKRAAQVKELLGPILFMSSEASSYMVGATINFDGGLICYESIME